jgi:hypothetical protein
MTLSGWIFLIVSWSVILSLFAFALTLTIRFERRHPGAEPFEIEEPQEPRGEGV